MRFVAFGDVHMTGHLCRQIPGIGEADLVIATGDLTNYGHRKDARLVLDEMLAVNPRLLAVLGNLDHFEINDYLEQLDLNLHGQARLIHGQVCLFGVGGSNITPFQTPSEFSERELHDILMRGYTQAREYSSLAPYSKRRMPLILVSHTPPRCTMVDRLTNVRHVGSAAVRTFIETYQPDLCLTGHIHEARGEDWLGRTHILNPGMMKKGGWVDIAINNSTITATLK